MSDDAIYDEEGLLPDELEAILDRRDVAAAFALGCRATAVHPGRQLLDPEEVGEHEELAAILDAHIDRIRSHACSTNAPVRIAALHALGCCRDTRDEDLALAMQLAIDDRDERAVATALLAVRGLAPDAAVELGRYQAAHRSRLVRICAVAATGEIDRAAAAVLVRAIDDPVRLPVEWGWRWQDHRETSASLAVRILRTATVAVDARVAVAQALARQARRRPIYLLAEAAMRIGFGEPYTPPPRGVSVEELDDAQRAAVAALGDEDDGLVRALGMHIPADVAPFLAGKRGASKPLSVEPGRRWHLHRIWREVLAGDLDEAVAAAILVEGLTSAQLVDALCEVRRVCQIFARGFEDDAQRACDTRLIRRVWEAVLARGVDLAALVRARAARGLVDDKAAALALLAARELELGEVVTKGIAWLPPDTVAELVAYLPEPRRRALQLAILEYLVRARGYDAAVATLRRASDVDVYLLLDAWGIAERGAAAARGHANLGAALELLRLAHHAAVVWASMSTSGAEGNQRMLDVDRLAKQVRDWERAS